MNKIIPYDFTVDDNYTPATFCVGGHFYTFTDGVRSTYCRCEHIKHFGMPEEEL